MIASWNFRCLLCCVACIATLSAWGEFVPDYSNEGAGEGFNDPTVTTSPITGLPSTLGEDRKAAFEAALVIVGSLIDTTDVTVEVNAVFDPLFGNESTATLGIAGPATSHLNYAGTARANTFFPAAEANQQAGSDLNGGGTAEINAAFNSDVDGMTVLGSTVWYYGLDGNPPVDTIEFFSTAMHELCHGAGFATLLDIGTFQMNGTWNDDASGEWLFGFEDIYGIQLRREGSVNKNFTAMTDEERAAAISAPNEVVWKGANVVNDTEFKVGGVRPEIYTPDPAESGSTLTHWDPGNTPNLLQEPFATDPFTHLTLELKAFLDMLWGSGGNPNNVFVNFAAGSNGNGLSGTPFDNLFDGVVFAKDSATINLAAGTSSETFPGSGISKPVTLQKSSGIGSVIIGDVAKSRKRSGGFVSVSP